MNTFFNPRKLVSPWLMSMITAIVIVLGVPNTAPAASFHHFGHHGRHFGYGYGYGYPYSYGRYSYGYPYSYGRYSNAYRSDRVPQDYADAVKSNRKDAEHGNANAQYNLGVMYSQGLGVTQDHAEAMKWYRKAAAQGAKMKLNNSDISS